LPVSPFLALPLGKVNLRKIQKNPILKANSCLLISIALSSRTFLDDRKPVPGQTGLVSAYPISSYIPENGLVPMLRGEPAAKLAAAVFSQA